MEYGIANLNTGRVKRFVNATNDLKKFGRLRLLTVMAEEGFTNTKASIKAYMDTWLEWEEEVNDDEDTELSTCGSQLVDVAADTITYTNVHLQKLPTGSNTWLPLSSEEKKVFYQAIVDKLETAY